MNIVLAFTHKRRAVAQFALKRAFRNLGHRVISVGPFDDSYAFGARECLPDVPLPVREPLHYDWSEGLVPPHLNKPDLLIVMTEGDDFRVTGAPIPLAQWNAGGEMEWPDTPFRYSVMPCEGATWLPPAFEYHAPRQAWPAARTYDLVHLATATPERMQRWHDVLVSAPDIHCVFGDIWGPLYATAYQHALATWTDTDAVSARLFEAIAMGCVVTAKRSDALASLLTAGDHFIPFDDAPEPAQLVALAHMLRTKGDNGMAKRAYAAVTAQHSYIHRARKIVMDVRAR